MTQRAFVFAGQGAQVVGMGKDLAEAFPACRELFAHADQILGYGLSKICFEGPEEELIKTRNCQPAIFVASVACHAALKASMGVPLPVIVGMAGLSLGEWTALHAGGAVGFDDALRLIEARARFMQEACEVQPGGMISVLGLNEEQLRPVAADAGVEIANINSDQQVVLSGPSARLGDAEKRAIAAGAKKVIPLKVAGAYHSSLMAGAAQKLAPLVRATTFQAPFLPVVSNVTALPHEGAVEIRDLMIKQVTSPVRWSQTIQWFKGQRGVGDYTEFGPGKVLSGLIKRIDRDAVVRNIQAALDLADATVALKS